MAYFKAVSVIFFLSLCSQSQAAIISYMDQASWESDLVGSSIHYEMFEADSVDLLSDSTQNPIGLFSVSVLGGGSDPGPTGLTGDGFFQSEVDSSGSDAVSVQFSFDPAWGFALLGLQNDALSNPSLLDLDEMAISAGEQSWVLSDLVGESTSDVPFLGFISDELIDSFSIFHAAAISDVTRTSEEYYIDGVAVASPAPVSVPEPSLLMILFPGLLGLFMARRVGL